MERTVIYRLGMAQHFPQHKIGTEITETTELGLTDFEAETLALFRCPVSIIRFGPRVKPLSASPLKGTVG